MDYLIQSGTLEDIADAIRAKTGGTGGLTPAEMVSEITGELVKPSGNKAITAGTSTQTGIDVKGYATVSVAPTPTEEKTATGIGDVTPTSGKYLSKVTIPAASVYTSAEKGTVSNHQIAITPKTRNTNAGWYTNGTSAGADAIVTASELVSGTKNITDTQVNDVTNFAYAQVVDANLVAGNIKKGVTVLGIVGSHEGGTTPVLVPKTITQNGTYDPADDNADGYSEVVVNVSGGGGGGAGIYGAEWAGTSDPSWTRTDDAANFSDPVPYVGGMTSGYGSPFDNIMPWAGMQIVEDPEAGILVSVPKFWYKLTGGGGSPLKIQIANHYVSGYSVSPMHMDRGDGKGERGIAFIGRYHCGSNYKSVTSVTPKVSITRSEARSGIHALGNNVWQGDFAMRFTIWLLYLVEYADWGSQWVIGAGCGDATSPMDGVKAMGYTDSMPYHTGTNLSSKRTFGYGTQYRYIEGLWDNCFDWMDGCYYNSNGLNLIKNTASFSDSSGGTLAGLPVSGTPKVMSVSTNGGYPIFYPTATGGSYESSTGAGGSITGEGSYVPDNWNFYSSYPCLCAGGYFFGYPDCGLFFVACDIAVGADDSRGCRLQKLP